jgi:hypothetical protein
MAVFEVEQDERGLRGRADAGGAEIDMSQGGESLLEQGVSPLGHAAHVADDFVVCALRLGQVPSLGLLERAPLLSRSSGGLV